MPGMTAEDVKAVLPEVLRVVRGWVGKINNLPRRKRLGYALKAARMDCGEEREVDCGEEREGSGSSRACCRTNDSPIKTTRQRCKRGRHVIARS